MTTALSVRGPFRGTLQEGPNPFKISEVKTRRF